LDDWSGVPSTLVIEVSQECLLWTASSLNHQLMLPVIKGLEDWVRNQLIPKHRQEGILQETPNYYNWGYFPTTKDLRNVAQQAIMQSRCSCFDQACTKCQ